MKIYLYITCLAFVALLFLAPSAWAYTNSEKGFSINPPESWSTEEGIEGVVVAFLGPVDPDVGYVNINVDVQNTLQSLSTIVENTKQSWSSTFLDYSLLTDKSLTVNGMSCHELEISYTDDGASCMQDSVLFVADDLLYQVTYFAGPTTYSSYLDVWEQSLNSFEIASWQSTDSSDGFPAT